MPHPNSIDPKTGKRYNFVPRPRKAGPSKAIPPTTMRIPFSKLQRASKVAKKYDRSRSWLINKYIDDGLERDERPESSLMGALG